ncbi:MAG: nitroreductase [Hydrogenophaga sp.]|uniref:nitroreductase family protein n=1 Tax=Hydrogenophaga sp. TaxID=1904254 RepID=UPI0016A005E6|nr:nitroreductase [Hydrogenophaga sp.]NIM43690.1 nitroreductase [Hydrogenophaga sp.]NIN28759.1 nitroreductase [Hydrogenophaga sp.]NIN33218.1 nitroreductase [Hydrogenophaga sp.]NIN57893.1 nitroreductase [Hydrogenophaga sp.]NIO54188.1 nitroreductase [Hydrogenophaga sp.]
MSTSPDSAPHDDPLEPMLSRVSVGTKYLREPAPSHDELLRMATAALRAPDHAGLVPYRFAVVRGAAKQDLANLFESAALAQGKSAEQAQRDRERATAPPLLVAVIARIDAGHPLATVHEQWIALGGALANFLTAAHALGYGGKMLSGSKVRDPSVVSAFCRPGETLVGWMVLGTPQGVGRPKFDKPTPAELLGEWPGSAGPTDTPHR